MKRHAEQHDTSDGSPACIKIPFHGRTVDLDFMLSVLTEYITDPGDHTSRIYHIDIAQEVIYYKLKILKYV